MQCLNAYNLKVIYLCLKICNADHVSVRIKVNKQARNFFTRCASKQYINNYQIHFWAINAVLMTFGAKKSVNLISKLGFLNLNALKTSKQYYYMTTIASGVFAYVVLSYKLNIFIWYFEKWYFHMFLLGFRRKPTALTLCKSIETAIQWFQIHHRITFATMPNSAVYLSGARVSTFPTLVPRL